MTKKNRRIIFYFLVIIFIIIGTFLVTYSKGWQFDFKTLSFYRSGAIALGGKPINSNIEIKIESHKINNSFRIDGLTILDLYSSVYTLTISKDGFSSWTKKLAVKPEMITKTYPIVLAPQIIAEEPTLKNIKNFWPGKKYNAYTTIDGKLIINGKNASGNTFSDWFASDNKAITYNTKTNSYFVVNMLQNNTATNLSLAFDNMINQLSPANSASTTAQISTTTSSTLTASSTSKIVINKIIPHPFDNNKVIILSSQKTYVLNLLDFSLAEIPLLPTLILAAKNNEIIFANSNGIYTYDLLTKSKKLITDQIKQKPLQFILSQSGNKILIEDNKSKLYLLDRNNQTVLPINKNVKYFSFSPDEQKIALLLNNNQIEIMFLENQNKWTDKKSGDITNLGTFNLNEKNPFIWHQNSAYLFIFQNDTNQLSLIEIDDRSNVNNQIIPSSIKNFYYNQNSNILYLHNSANELRKIILE